MSGRSFPTNCEQKLIKSEVLDYACFGDKLFAFNAGLVNNDPTERLPYVLSSPALVFCLQPLMI